MAQNRAATARLTFSLVIAFIALAALAAPFALPAQILHATAPRPSFQVATLKPGRPGDIRFGMGFSDGGRGFACTNATLRDLLQEAYNVKSANQIVGASGWMLTDKFDVEARFDDKDLPSLDHLPFADKIQQVRLMLQSLLEERFALQLASSSRDARIFTLVQAQGGSKMKPSPMAPADPAGIDVPHPVSGPRVLRKAVGRLEASGVAVSLLIDILARMPELGAEGGFTMGDLIIDRTGLTGAFDWVLTWTPDQVNQAADAGGEAASGPSLFTALKEQLGLRLERGRGPVEVLIIRHAERPSAN